jgi:hypothetical protein
VIVMPSHLAAPSELLVATGRSVGAMARGVSGPAEPLGEARKKFAGWGTPVSDRVPEAVTGEPPTASQLGAERPTPETVPAPFAVKTPPAQVIVVPSHLEAPNTLVVAIGRSPGAIARGANGPVEPLGEARNRFAASDAPVKERVPEVVIGEPLTASQFGAERPTLFTVPPAAGVAQVPSPRQ